MTDKNAVEVVDNLPAKRSDSILEIIEKIALMPDGAADNIERMHAIHEATLDREAEMAFNIDFVAAQLEMLNHPVVKDAMNDQTKSKYARAEIIDKIIKPIYTRHGFGMIGDTDDSPLEAHIRVVYDLIHKAGHSRRGKYDCPLDRAGIAGKTNKTDTHARGSSLTYGKRYLKCLMWDVQIVEDDDGNGADSDDNLDALDQWMVRLDEWAEATNSKTLPKFWHKNEKAIVKECGKVNAAKIYKAMNKTVAEMKAAEGASNG